MSLRSQITRNGVVIGEHDERTLLALLNAGALRLTDAYWHRGMKHPAPLAELLCGGFRRPWRDRMRPWLAVLVLAALLVSALWLRASTLVEAVARAQPSEVVMAAVDPLAGLEIRRATPVIVGRLAFNVVPRESSDSVSAKAVSHAIYSRAAVLALDAEEKPLAIGSGVVVGDGTRLIAALRTVAGAAAVEVHLADGSVRRPAQALVSAENGTVVFELETGAVPLAWAQEKTPAGAAVSLAGHTLSDEANLTEAKIAESLSRSGAFRLDRKLPSSLDGAAVLDAAGDLAGIVTDAAGGVMMASAAVQKLMQSGIPGGLDALASLPRQVARTGLQAMDAQVQDGSVVVTLLNRTDHVLRHALLHIACYEAPAEAAEVAALQQRLRSAAVQASLAPDDAADVSLTVRQALREVSERLESARSRLRLALPAAQRRVVRHQLLAIECELTPGLPQAISHEISAGSNWGAMATVLDAGS